MLFIDKMVHIPVVLQKLVQLLEQFIDVVDDVPVVLQRQVDLPNC